ETDSPQVAGAGNSSAAGFSPKRTFTAQAALRKLSRGLAFSAQPVALALHNDRSYAAAQTKSTTQRKGVATAPQVANFPVNIGTLRAGDSVQITFSVTVNTPYSGGANVSNQGTVSGSNFANVLTDDPDTATPNDATLTPIVLPNITAHNATAAEPASGTNSMLFTVTLSMPASAGGVAVNYATADQAPGAGHATGGATCHGTADYHTTSGALNFASGERVKTVAVSVCADSI